MNEVQKIILTCLLGPEDKTGFRKLQMREQKKAARLRDPEKFKDREREQHHKHKEKRSVRNKKWRSENEGPIKAYKAENKERDSEANKEWYRQHPLAHRKASKLYREKYPGASQIRSRICNFLKGRIKNASTPELLGCELDAFGWWIESQFLPGMTWENYGYLWEVDHIIPLSWFDQTDLLWQHKAFHFTNTQPLWKTENRAKGNRYVMR